jgi:hypothetical protein
MSQQPNKRLELMGTDGGEGSRWVARPVSIVHVRRMLIMRGATSGGAPVSELPAAQAQGR